MAQPRCCGPQANIKNYETRKKALRHKGFLLFLTRFCLERDCF
jgi:hypothetical protein